jgi:quinol monooxygenase YgiN
MTQPCIILATLKPAAGKKDAVLALFEKVMPAVHEEEGCELYALYEDVDGALHMIEKWTSWDLWQVHMAGAPVAAIQSGLEGLLESDVLIEEMYGLNVGLAGKAAL